MSDTKRFLDEDGLRTLIRNIKAKFGFYLTKEQARTMFDGHVVVKENRDALPAIGENGVIYYVGNTVVVVATKEDLPETGDAETTYLVGPSTTNKYTIYMWNGTTYVKGSTVSRVDDAHHYDEYIWDSVNSVYIKVGEHGIDLGEYVLKADLDALVAENDYAKKTYADQASEIKLSEPKTTDWEPGHVLDITAYGVLHDLKVLPVQLTELVINFAIPAREGLVNTAVVSFRPGAETFVLSVQDNGEACPVSGMPDAFDTNSVYQVSYMHGCAVIGEFSIVE